MRRAAVLLLTSLALAGCNTTGFIYRVDTSIDIVRPEDRELVDLPVTVRWRDERGSSDFRVAPEDPAAQYYAVFLDRSPMGPGKTLTSLLPEKDQPSCRRDPLCPSPERLRDLGVVLTAQPAITLEFLSDLRPSSRSTRKDPHEVTIVRMRGDQRVGEAAFRTDFFVRR